ncbi:MAG: PAS domain S-box protein [Methanoregula sp.]|jgi:PAS domain S-box-containing protein
MSEMDPRPSVFRFLENTPVAVSLIAITTACVVLVNFYAIARGMTAVFPHLFYIPIILAAYAFPRRGIVFSCFISAIYCGMVLQFVPFPSLDLAFALGRAAMFILIGAVVSFLTMQLQENARLFMGVAERSSDIILLTDREGRAIYVSPAFGILLGLDRAVIPGKRPDDLIHPDDLDNLYTMFRNIAKTLEPARITARTRKADGGYILIEYLAIPVITHGEFSGLQIVGRDMTEHQRVEEAYRETGRRMAEIISFLPDPTLVVDRKGTVVAWNHAMEVLSGIRAADVMGKGKETYKSWIEGETGPLLIEDVLHMDREEIRHRYDRIRFDGDTIRTEREVTRTDGTRFFLWVSATRLADSDNKITGAIESFRDVTHQKQIERELRESNTYLDTVMNTLADPLFIKDRSYRFVRLNNSFCRFTGCSREEMLGKTDYDFFSNEEAEVFRKNDDEVFRTGQINENEETITDASGTFHTIVTKKTLYTNAVGEKFVVGIIRDITDRKKTEYALQQALKKLNMLSSITRHDILNQLMGLRTYLALMAEDEKDPAIREFLKNGDRAAEAIQRQIEFTRYYENLGVQAPCWQDVAEVFSSAAAQLPLGGIAVEIQVAGISVYADPLIGKVFYNLIENSLRHGGHMTRMELRAQEAGDGGLVLIYRDNGTGISPEDKKNLFKRGFGKHTGLGLFLSQEILSITGITIAETGTYGTGVQFEIAIPHGVWRRA